ncbi:hypothetical protein A2U01_0086482, partial [Trifolium medium]|nr:hypothetical protein [Trifolium medium]
MALFFGCNAAQEVWMDARLWPQLQQGSQSNKINRRATEALDDWLK